jgi:hypothetical protein
MQRTFFNRLWNLISPVSKANRQATIYTRLPDPVYYMGRRVRKMPPGIARGITLSAQARDSHMRRRAQYRGQYA